MQTRFSAIPSIPEDAIKSIKPIRASFGLAYCEDGSVWVIPLSCKGNPIHDTNGDVHTLAELEIGQTMARDEHLDSHIYDCINIGKNAYYEESKSSQTKDRQYYEKIIKDAYGSKKGLETVEEGIRFTDTLRALFCIKPYNKKGSGRI